MSSTPEARRTRLVVLISGAGSNMLAIAEACRSGRIGADLVLVLSDNHDAGGIARAKAQGVNAAVVDRLQFQRNGKPDRQAFEDALAKCIDDSQADLVILAGFMRVLSAVFVSRYAGRLLNIHPSLLPRYKGLDTHARALAAGDTEHGVSVHFVTADLDGGPLIAQAKVPVLPGDDVAALSARVHVREHMLYPMVIEWLASGRLQWNQGAPTLDGNPLSEPVQLP